MLLELCVGSFWVRLDKGAELESVYGRSEHTCCAQLGANALGARVTAFCDIAAHVGPLYVTASTNASIGYMDGLRTLRQHPWFQHQP